MNPESSFRVYNYRAVQSGNYFHGYCAGVKTDEQRITFLDRMLPRYSFEPGAVEPTVEVKNAGPLTLLKKHFHITATTVVPPLWFQQET